MQSDRYKGFELQNKSQPRKNVRKTLVRLFALQRHLILDSKATYSSTPIYLQPIHDQ